MSHPKVTLRTICAPSTFHLQDYAKMHSEQNTKKCVYCRQLLPEYSVKLQQSKGNPMLRFRGSIQRFYITDRKKRERFVAFPRQQWLRESATMLRHMYIAYLVVGLLRPSSVPPGKWHDTTWNRATSNPSKFPHSLWFLCHYRPNQTSVQEPTAT